MDRRFKIALLLIAALCAACRNGSSESRRPGQDPPQRDQPLAAGAAATITTVAPEYRKRVTVLQTNGKVQFNEERLVRVNAPLTGRVVEVLARPGDVVEPGHRLLLLDSPDLGSAKSDYAKAVSDLGRSEEAPNLSRGPVAGKS